MPQIFEEDEKWKITTQHKEYILDGKQMQILKSAMVGGSRGSVWFKNYCIVIPYIIGIDKIVSGKKIIDKKRAEYAKQFGVK